MAQIPLSDCCELDDSATFSFDYSYKMADAMSSFLPQYCSPCPLEVSRLWPFLMVESFGEGLGSCSSSFVITLLVGLLTFILYAAILAKRILAGKRDVALGMASTMLVLSFSNILSGALGVSGAWCSNLAALIAVRQFNGLGVAAFFIMVSLQAFWYLSMTAKQLTSVGKVLAAAKYPLAAVVVIIVFFVGIFEPNLSVFLSADFGASTAGVTMGLAIGFITVSFGALLVVCLLVFSVTKVSASLSGSDTGASWREAALKRVTRNGSLIIGMLTFYILVRFVALALPSLSAEAQIEATPAVWAFSVYLPLLIPHFIGVTALFPFVRPASSGKGGGATSSTSDSLADSLLDDSSDSDSSSSSSSSSSSGDSSSVELSEI